MSKGNFIWEGITMDRKNESIRGRFRRSYESPALYGMPTTSPYEMYLTIEDVKRVTGLKAVRQVPFHPEEFLGSDLNFVNEQGEKVLCVTFSRAGLYDTYRSTVPKYFKTPVSDVGEEAFLGPDMESREPFMLVFRKGDHAVSLTTAPTNDASRNLLTAEQLVAIGAIIASRL
jgi:hypothetical protein